ncbi:unnamed protein product, partial [Didymodactylos carnosus]
MKVARLHMKHIEQLMSTVKNDLNLKVVFLVRDPRGIYSSRKAMDWCVNTPCIDVQNLCNEMRVDLKVFRRLKQSNPNQFNLIKYEDLSSNPERETRILFKQLQIPYTKTVQRFLETHTSEKIHSNDVDNP